MLQAQDQWTVFSLCCSKDTRQTPCWNSVDLKAKLSTTANQRLLQQLNIITYHWSDINIIINIAQHGQPFSEPIKGIKSQYTNNSLHLARKYAWMLVSRHYLFLEANSFPRVKLEENLRFKEQIMSKVKYPSIFLRQLEAIVFIILQIFFITCAFWKIGEHSVKLHVT